MNKLIIALLSLISLNCFSAPVNINTADAKTLKHPYLTWSQANAIVAYRNQHGPFANTDELKKIMMLDQVTLDRYKPYLTIK
jgi:competence ComEA-like helix-hairpin-helix protein